MPSSRRATAAFCANDLLALGLLQEMTRRKLRVPGDLAIVGYDDIDFAAAAAVPLSSVRQPRDQLGRAAAQLLIQETTEGRSHSHPPDGLRTAARRARLQRPAPLTVVG